MSNITWIDFLFTSSLHNRGHYFLPTNHPELLIKAESHHRTLEFIDAN